MAWLKSRSDHCDPSSRIELPAAIISAAIPGDNGNRADHIEVIVRLEHFTSVAA